LKTAHFPEWESLPSAPNLVPYERSPISRLNRMRPQLPRRVEQLAVAGEEGAAFGPAQAAGQGCNKLPGALAPAFDTWETRKFIHFAK